jgi:hypothetical protein
MAGSRWWADTSGRRAFPCLTKAFSSAGCRTCGTQVRPATEGTHPHPRREKFLSTLQGRSLQAAGGRPRPVTPRPLAEDAPSALRHQREPLRQLAHPGFLHTTKPQLSLQHVVEDTGDGKVPEPDPAGQAASNRPWAADLPARPRISGMDHAGTIGSWPLGEGPVKHGCRPT